MVAGNRQRGWHWWGGFAFSTPQNVSPPCFTGRAEENCNPTRPQLADSGTAFSNGKDISLLVSGCPTVSGG